MSWYIVRCFHELVYRPVGISSGWYIIRLVYPPVGISSADRLYNVTPQQLHLIESERKSYLILGAAGTGKTIVTKIKLLNHIKCGREKGTTALFVPENMIQEYQQFLEDNALYIASDGKSPILDMKSVIRIHSLSTDYIRNLREELKAGSNIFIDDSQHFYQFQRMFDLRDELNQWRLDFPDRIIWIILDWFQFLVKGPLFANSLIIPTWIFPDAAFHLDLIMRNTSEIMRLAIALQTAQSQLFTSAMLPDDKIIKGIIKLDVQQDMKVERESKNDGNERANN